MRATARPTRRPARLLTAITAVVLATGISVTHTAAADTGSTSLDTDRALTETITHGNVTITDAIIGNNVGYHGDTVTFRTTIAATEGTAEITQFHDGTSASACTPIWTSCPAPSPTRTPPANESPIPPYTDHRIRIP